jgi:hypothetical protein
MRKKGMLWLCGIVLALSLLTACGEAETLQADAGDDFSIPVGEQPTFDGCGSTGGIVNYKWTIISAPPGMMEDEGKVIREVDMNCSFTLDAEMGVDEVGLWEIELEISDEAGKTNTDQVTVEVTE